MIRLYPFQRADVNKLKQVDNRLIANEMGTGKTYEAIALDLVDRGNTMTLVVAPLSTIRTTWLDHIQTLTNLDVICIDPKNRSEFIRAVKARSHHVYICHWDALRLADMECLRQVNWGHVIADEVHRIKNRKTKTTACLKLIPAVQKTGLTGTPVMNQPDDLWSILHWLWPKDPEFRSYWRFYEKYVNYTIVNNQFRKVLGPKNEGKLMKSIEPIYTRRLKRDVLTDLPPKYNTEVMVDLDSKQRRAYDDMKRRFIAWLENETEEEVPLVAPVVIAQITQLQKLALAYSDGNVMVDPSAKLDAFMEMVHDNPDKQMVVFSQYAQAIRLLQKRLDAKGVSYGRVIGDDSPKVRDKSIRDFRKGRNQLFLGTIGAGSEGIQLQTASTVVFLDRDWTPARNVQAEDRLHRVGQRSAVQVIDIRARNTIDQYKELKLEFKKSWIRRMFND